MKAKKVEIMTNSLKEMRSINPANNELLGIFQRHTVDQVESAVERSWKTFQTYRKTSFRERSQILLRAAEILESEKERWGKLMSLEMGKTMKSGMEEAQKCAWCCRYYAENGEAFLSNEVAPIKAGEKRFVQYTPLGPVLAIMPWNFPFWQVIRFLAPALMAGNTALLKHASNVPQCALAIEEILLRAGMPDGLFQTLLISSKEVPSLINDPRIRAVTLTGSEEAGMDVASQAGRNLMKVVLELGGSDPFIVMPTADLEKTVKMAVKARTMNNGESCVAAKRFIIHEAIADAFENKFVEAMRALKVGDPLDSETDIGPLATPSIRESLMDQLERSIKAGARVLTGGKAIAGSGNYFEPTIITNITSDSSTYYEEFFGPVALLFRVKNLEEAMKIANNTQFGLGATFWSNDPEEQNVFIRDIEAGMAFVNAQVASDPALPFGGMKRSGIGRELSHFGIREFTNIKTVVLAE
jgi:succinate-semialdehyde dehydrogenase/glutarate-semialdehyde dehydrogenase